MTEAARVLIVEDTPGQAELARALLSGLGYDLKLAATAGAALDIARDWRPDALLLHGAGEQHELVVIAGRNNEVWVQRPDAQRHV